MTSSLQPLSSPLLSDINAIHHGFFSRLGGVSTGLYRELNCGLGSNDDQKNIAENRRRVAAHLNVVPENFLNMYQIHSANVAVVEETWPTSKAPQVDAMVTSKTGIALSILTADCAPILFCDPENKVIAASHAGWKGALSGIIEQTIETMEKLGANRDKVRAAIGPCISQKNYEVGPEFKELFCTQNKLFINFFSPAPDQNSDRFFFDLPGFVTSKLHQNGVNFINQLSICTYENYGKYFSFRKSTHLIEPDYGRNVSAIVLRNET